MAYELVNNVQYDNGTEFHGMWKASIFYVLLFLMLIISADVNQGALYHFLCEFGIKSICNSPHHLQ
jgi:hypothetical protein